MSSDAITPVTQEKRRKLTKKTKWGIAIALISVPLILFGLGSIDASPDDYTAVTPIKRTPPPENENILFYMNQVSDFSSSGQKWMDKLANIDGAPEDSPYRSLVSI